MHSIIWSTSFRQIKINNVNFTSINNLYKKKVIVEQTYTLIYIWCLSLSQFDIKAEWGFLDNTYSSRLISYWNFIVWISTTSPKKKILRIACGILICLFITCFSFNYTLHFILQRIYRLELTFDSTTDCLFIRLCNNVGI
jgi:hypothetical protein